MRAYFRHMSTYFGMLSIFLFFDVRARASVSLFVLTHIYIYIYIYVYQSWLVAPLRVLTQVNEEQR